MEMILAGGIGEDAWPPAWPPNLDSNDQDERQLATLAEKTGLDEAGWDRVCDDARELVGMAEFKQLATSLATLLEHGISLNERMLKHAFEHVMRESIKGMHKQLDRLNAEIRQLSQEIDEDERVPRAEAEAFLRSWFGR